ncbi:hypothetical protein NC651_006463 [Populus alba x Populus x berolinensis]|nr:hypothetical protein NC651_006463 [Populus alba x Populus x berolinensis]
MNKFGFSIWSCYGLRCVVRKPAVVMIAGVDGGGKTTSLGLHTNYSLMDELIACKKAAGKIVRGAPDFYLDFLDKIYGYNHRLWKTRFRDEISSSS